MKRINLNADMGESFGVYSIADDAALMDLIDSANIACGFHAGDPWVMQQSLAMACAKGVEVGAHPGFPDLQGFGRREMYIAPHELESMIAYQIAALMGMAIREGVKVAYVKPHGALNNMACRDKKLAQAIVSAILSMQSDLGLLAPACSRLYQAGKQAGLDVYSEIFIDRHYAEDGQLLPRSRKDAVIREPHVAVRRALSMLETGTIRPLESNTFLKTEIHSLCLHGDHPEAYETAKMITALLKEQCWRRCILKDM